MNEKKVEIIDTKPRGKGQCRPEQTSGGTPRFVSVFDHFQMCISCLGQNG